MYFLRTLRAVDDPLMHLRKLHEMTQVYSIKLILQQEATKKFRRIVHMHYDPWCMTIISWTSYSYQSLILTFFTIQIFWIYVLPASLQKDLVYIMTVSIDMEEGNTEFSKKIFVSKVTWVFNLKIRHCAHRFNRLAVEMLKNIFCLRHITSCYQLRWVDTFAFVLKKNKLRQYYHP